MATGRNDHNYGTSSLIRRDFRQDRGSGPEEMKGKPKKKAGRWCKGKEGREHEFEWATYRSYWYGPPEKRVLEESKTWICKKCGKQDYMRRYKAAKENAKHKHIYSKTAIVEETSFYSILYEICEVCNRHGKSEFFWN